MFGGKLSLEGFWERYEDMWYNVIHHKCILHYYTYHILLVEFGGCFMELYALKLATSFRQRFVYLPSSWLVNFKVSLSWHLTEQGFDTLQKMTNIWKASWSLVHEWGMNDAPTPPNSIYDALNQVFLAKEWKRNYRISTSKNFSSMNVIRTWSKHWQHKIKSQLWNYLFTNFAWPSKRAYLQDANLWTSMGAIQE